MNNLIKPYVREIKCVVDLVSKEEVEGKYEKRVVRGQEHIPDEKKDFFYFYSSELVDLVNQRANAEYSKEGVLEGLYSPPLNEKELSLAYDGLEKGILGGLPHTICGNGLNVAGALNNWVPSSILTYIELDNLKR